MGSQVRHRGLPWLVAVSVIAGLTLVVTAGGSGATTGGRGQICSQPGLHSRGFTCADMSVVLTHEFDRVEIGRPFKAKLAVHNFGPFGANNVTASDTIPSTMTFVSASTSQGSCTGPPVGTNGVVNCTIGSVAQGATVNVVVRIRPTETVMRNNMASTSATTFDPNSPNNTDTDPIDVQTNGRGCTMVGTVNADVLTGSAEADVICGLRGADQIDGAGGADVLYGERGADQLTDHNGTDNLRGGEGPDSIDTADGAGGDTANGGFGADTCTTDGGDTRLNCP